MESVVAPRSPPCWSPKRRTFCWCDTRRHTCSTCTERTERSSRDTPGWDSRTSRASSPSADRSRRSMAALSCNRKNIFFIFPCIVLLHYRLHKKNSVLSVGTSPKFLELKFSRDLEHAGNHHMKFRSNWYVSALVHFKPTFSSVTLPLSLFMIVDRHRLQIPSSDDSSLSKIQILLNAHVIGMLLFIQEMLREFDYRYIRYCKYFYIVLSKNY